MNDLVNNILHDIGLRICLHQGTFLNFDASGIIWFFFNQFDDFICVCVSHNWVLPQKIIFS